ncbi:unnamed protein product [Merluccius merluccius]
MPKHCAYGLCNTDSRYPKTLEGGVEFLLFPKPKTNLDKCREWIKQCGRPHSQLNVSKITKNTYICSKHFVNGRPTPEFPNPIAAHPVSGREHQGGCRRPPQKRCDQPETNTSISTEEHTSQQSDNDTEARDLGNQEEVRTLRDALTAREQEVISLRVKLEAKDRELHLHNQLHVWKWVSNENLSYDRWHRTPDRGLCGSLNARVTDDRKLLGVECGEELSSVCEGKFPVYNCN